MKKKVAVIGLGKMGRNHARELKSLESLGCCVDVNPLVKSVADKLGVPFIFCDVSKESFLPPEVARCEIWDIVTMPDSHSPLLLLGCVLGKEIFIEKPPLESAKAIEDILQKFPKAKIGVDYLEMVNPILQIICRKMRDLKLKPVYFLHHREKNQVQERGERGERVVLDDLVHDFSQIDFVRHAVSEKSFAVDLPKVEKTRIQTYKEAGYSHSADARAEFILKFSDGTVAEVKGSLIDSYHRQFVILTDQDTAFYGNTLERDFIKPAAAMIRGTENISKIVRLTRGCAIKNEQTQEQALESVKAHCMMPEIAQWLAEQNCQKKNLGTVPLWIMLKNFLEAASKEELICSLDRAYYYQKIAEDVYAASGHPPP